MRARLFIVLSALAAMIWAVPGFGAAHFHANRATNAIRPVPLPAYFQFEKERGLLLRVWVNGKGPFVFALDTGAGLNVIADRVVTSARLQTRSVSPTIVGGLSSARTSSNREAVIDELAVGNRGNVLPQRQAALIVKNLPPELDGVIDPTEAYAPFGYAIDMPNERVEAIESISPNTSRAEGTTVSWLRPGGDDRPFVRLGDGRLALVDTGSRYGLAVSDRNAVIVGRNGVIRRNEVARDIGGGTIVSRRVSPTTVSIGDLRLRRIPTDILFGIDKGAPVILGRDALYPFKISFDRQKQLIAFVTSNKV